MINATNNNSISTNRNKIAENNLFNALTHQKDKKKPQAPKGYLLERKNVVNNLIDDVADFGKDIKNTGKAIVTGKSNDHALGKINDLGMKIGALAIASYLALKKGTAKQKAMEFIGGATFLTTMSLWPKYTVTKPLEKKFGFNIQQEYVDSQGRRKKFFGDNQYQPWDLWSKDKINQVADYMGVPKDLPDREEFTKKKMQKVALQGNTWILLTSGFATPLITALVCRAAENPVENFLINRNLKKAAGKAADMMRKGVGEDANVKTIIDKMIADKTFDKFNKQDFMKALEQFKGKGLDEETLRELTKFLDPIEELAKDKNRAAHVLPADLNGAANEIARSILGSIESTYDKTVLGEMKKILSPEEFDQLSEFMTNLAPTADGKLDVVSINRKISEILKSKKISPKEHRAIKNNLAEVEKTANIFEKLLKALRMDDASKGVESLYDMQRGKRAEVRVMSNLADALAGNHKESLYTKVGEEFNKELMRQINPDGKTLKNFKTKDEFIELLHKNFEKLATNVGSKRRKGDGGILEGARGTLEYFVKNVSSSLKKLDTDYDKFFEQGSADALKGKLKTVPVLDKVVDKYADRLAFNVRLAKLMKQGEGSKLIITADAERRLSLLKASPEKLKEAFEVTSDDQVKQVLGAIREYLYDRTSLSRNLSNNFSADISKKAIKFIYESDMDEKVVTELRENGTLNIVERARQLFNVISQMDGEFPRSCEIQKALDDANYIKEHPDLAEPIKALKDAFGDHAKDFIDKYHGDSFVNRFTNILKDGSIAKKWLKTFGIAAAVLAVVTIVATKFFGNTDKEQELYEKKGARNAKNKQ